MWTNNNIFLGWYQTCSPEFKKINPSATVPVLVHSGHPCYESDEQILYIDQNFEGPILSPPQLDAEINKWVEFTSLKCGAGFTKAATEIRIGCCVPGLSLPLFAAMIPEIE